jgi:hypothetical protein
VAIPGHGEAQDMTSVCGEAVPFRVWGRSLGEAEQESHILAFVENLRVTSRLAAD